MPARPIVLIGMPLSGKTTVGALLARELGWPFVDLDEAIVTRTGRSIEDWLREGESAFRQVEHRVLSEELGLGDERVIASGGGTLELDQSLSLCLEKATLVYLVATVPALLERGSKPTGRPLLDDSQDASTWLTQVLVKRAPHYERAHLHLDTVHRRPEELARMVADVVRNRG